MDKVEDNSRLTATAELRRRAEVRLRAKSIKSNSSGTEESTQRLVHELEVHQIELEMQNAELCQARDDVEKTLEKYTDLFDFAPVGYCNLTSDGIVLLANLTTASLLGVERSRLLGRRFEQFVMDGYRLIFTGFLEKVFASRGNKESCEVALSTEGNSSLIAHVEAFACMSGQECRLAIINITERRYAEALLAEKQRELVELNSSLETRIVKAVDDLRQKDQMLILQDRRAVMGEMINNIAHQWRQPLNILGLYIQELPYAYEAGEFSREYLEENTRKGMEVIQHMSQTIDGFRKFFRPDREIVDFVVNHVIARTLSLIEKSFQEQGIKIVLDQEGDLMAKGFPNEYAQVLLNILMNSRDALVEQKVEEALISMRTFTEGNLAVVTIADNGGGIAGEIIERIFDPYFTTKGPDKGTGIGLFMSKNIIENHMGGRLTVLNTGSGAEFRIEV
ncbi:MAG: ATP-binding protein [Deltaproteobacteria bacterium]|nr:ATP-binding protein [Deltaproteobacteria bacterium]